MTKLRAEVCSLMEHKHLKYPYKNLKELEIDIHHLTQEIEQTELAK